MDWDVKIAKLIEAAPAVLLHLELERTHLTATDLVFFYIFASHI